MKKFTYDQLSKPAQFNAVSWFIDAQLAGEVTDYSAYKGLNKEEILFFCAPAIVDEMREDGHVFDKTGKRLS